MMARVLAALLAMLLFTPAALPDVPGTPHQALSEIDTRGAAAFLAGLTPDDVDRLYGHFDSGDARWLAMVPKLAAVADGANAEGLTISLAYALPKNAPGALGLMTVADGVLGVDRVCSIPFIEQSARDRKMYRHKALAAVGKVNDPSLSVVRDLCLTALKRPK